MTSTTPQPSLGQSLASAGRRFAALSLIAIALMVGWMLLDAPLTRFTLTVAGLWFILDLLLQRLPRKEAVRTRAVMLAVCMFIVYLGASLPTINV